MKLGLNIEKLLFIIFAGAFIIQLTYFLVLFIRLVLKQKPVVIEKLKPVSIIIAARNEEVQAKGQRGFFWKSKEEAL